MKKIYVLIVVTMLFCISAVPALAWQFNMRLFSNSNQFVIEYDEMDGSGEISYVDECFLIDKAHYTSYYSNSDDFSINGLVKLYTDIVVLEDFPPVIRLTLVYCGYQPLNIRKVIMKPGDTRYTFTVDSHVYKRNGYAQEYVTLVITDENWQLMNDIVYYGNVFQGVQCRLVGDSEKDVVLIGLWDNIDGIKAIRDTYYNALKMEAEDEFDAFKIAYPCEVKTVKTYK